MPDYVDLGYAYALEDNFSIKSGETINILIDYSTYTDFSPSNVDNRGAQRNGYVLVDPPFFQSDTGPMEIVVYRGTDYSGGSATAYAKVNTLSDAAPQVTITTGATGSDKGTVALRYLIGSTANRGFARGGGTAGGASFYKRGTEDKTLVEITNNSADDGTVHYGQVFFEV
jgi:hypothetical protein